MRPRGEGIADHPALVDGLAVWPVFRVQRSASRQQRGGDDQRIIDGKSVTLGDVESEIMRLQGERFDGADRAHRLQPLSNFGIRQAELARGHRRELVEDPHADRAALGQHRLGAIGLVARCQAIKT